jgi:uncharacterized membrane protein
MLFQSLLILHIIAGFSALLSGAMAIVSRKGAKNHLKSGKWYVLSMFVVGASAIAMTQLKSNTFLFTVGVFTLYLTYAGQRAIFYFRLKEAFRTGWRDIVPTVIALVVSLGMVGQPIFQMVKSNTFSVSVMAVFGGILMGFAIRDMRMIFQNPTFQPNNKTWLIKHIGLMGGAYISTLTAFLVTNVSFSPGWVIWLTPTLIGSILIARASKEWRLKLNINL